MISQLPDFLWSRRPTAILVPVVVAVLVLGGMLVLAPEAAAESVELASGKTLEAHRVEIEEQGLRLFLHLGGGHGEIVVAFHRLAIEPLLERLEAAWLSGADPVADGAALVRLAALAEARNRPDLVADLLVRAADVDPALADTRDAGLAAIRDARVRTFLTSLETALRAGRHAAVVARGQGVDATPDGALLTPVERLRVRALVRLARAHLPAPAPLGMAPDNAPPVQPEVPPAPAPVDLTPAQQAALTKAGVAHAGGLAARDLAADPALSDTRARRHLERAARLLLEARRGLLALAPPVPTPVPEVLDALRQDLLDVYLQIAEILRTAERWPDVERYLRAARLLAPEHPRVLDLARRLDEDRRRAQEPLLPYDPTLPFGVVEHYWLGHSLLHGPGLHGPGFGPHLHGVLHFGSHTHYRRSRGLVRRGARRVRRVVGRRR